MKAKELARKLVEGVKVEPIEENFDIGKVTDDTEEIYNKNAEEVFFELLKELTEYCKIKKIDAALKDIITKSEMIIARANVLLGIDTFSNYFFVAYFIGFGDSEDTTDQFKKMIEICGGHQTYQKIKSAIMITDSYKSAMGIINKQKEQEENVRNLHPYRVASWDELLSGKRNIHLETLGILAAIGNYHSCGIPIEFMKPLIRRGNFLRTVINEHNGILTKELIDAFEKEEKKFAEEDEKNINEGWCDRYGKH